MSLQFLKKTGLNKVQIASVIGILIIGAGLIVFSYPTQETDYYGYVRSHGNHPLGLALVEVGTVITSLSLLVMGFLSEGDDRYRATLIGSSVALLVVLIFIGLLFGMNV